MKYKYLLFLSLLRTSLVACLNTYDIEGHAELETLMAKLDLAPKLLLGPQDKELRDLDLNIDRIKVTGTLAGDSVVIPIHMADAYKHSTVVTEFNKTLETDYRSRTNQAVLKIRSHQYLSAIEILKSVEQETPGMYATATNLGTAYELAGDVEHARKWIATGIERNPKAHQGTEWVHLAILDAKLKLEKDPQWLDSNRVVEAKVTERGAEEIIAAVEYQLEERLVFVKAPDPTVSSLFETLGELYQTRDSEKAEAYQKQAVEFSEETNA